MFKVAMSPSNNVGGDKNMCRHSDNIKNGELTLGSYGRCLLAVSEKFIGQMGELLLNFLYNKNKTKA